MKQYHKPNDWHEIYFNLYRFTCQFQHGNSPVYAGRPANWLGLAFIERLAGRLLLGCAHTFEAIGLKSAGLPFRGPYLPYLKPA